jgi:hypothetical protein
MTPPSPAIIRAARIAAGHTQPQAAEMVYAGSYRTWQDWEAGRREMPRAIYEFYLLMTGQAQLAKLRRQRLVARR